MNGERSKRGKKSQRKGKRGEKRTADKFRKALAGCKVQVTQRNQFKWSGKHNPEVSIHEPGNYMGQIIHIENKNSESAGIRATFKQAIRDARPGVIPIAVTKRNREREIATLWLDDLLPMIWAWLLTE